MTGGLSAFTLATNVMASLLFSDEELCQHAKGNLLKQPR